MWQTRLFKLLCSFLLLFCSLHQLKRKFKTIFFSFFSSHLKTRLVALERTVQHGLFTRAALAASLGPSKNEVLWNGIKGQLLCCSCSNWDLVTTVRTAVVRKKRPTQRADESIAAFKKAAFATKTDTNTTFEPVKLFFLLVFEPIKRFSGFVHFFSFVRNCNWHASLQKNRGFLETFSTQVATSPHLTHECCMYTILSDTSFLGRLKYFPKSSNP